MLRKRQRRCSSAEERKAYPRLAQTETTRAMVRYTIETVLDLLPRTYSKELYEQKCDLLDSHFYEAYPGQGQSLDLGTN